MEFLQKMEKEKKLIKIEVNPNEKWVIDCWRHKYRFGNLEIKIHEGTPVMLEKVRIKEQPPKT